MPQMHPTRLPSNMPTRVRAKLDPDVQLAWLEREGFNDPVCGHSPTAPPADDPVNRYTTTWMPHEPHKGRRPPTKGVANFRGSIVDGHRQELVLESTLEKAAAVIGVAFHKKRRLRSQVGPVPHEDEQGKERHSTLDFTLDAGVYRDVAIAVKPRRRVESSGLMATVAAIREQRPDFAGRIEIWTEKQLPRYAEHNADLFLRCRRDRRAEDIERIKRLAEKVDFKIDIRLLMRQSGLWDARAFVATVNLIDDGFLVAEPHQRVGHRTKVRRAA